MIESWDQTNVKPDHPGMFSKAIDLLMPKNPQTIFMFLKAIDLTYAKKNPINHFYFEASSSWVFCN